MGECLCLKTVFRQGCNAFSRVLEATWHPRDRTRYDQPNAQCEHEFGVRRERLFSVLIYLRQVPETSADRRLAVMLYLSI